MNEQDPTNLVSTDFGQVALPTRRAVEATVKLLPGHIEGMRRKCHFYPTWKGVLLALENHGTRRGWDLYLNEELVDEGFGSAEEAADAAHHRDFNDQAWASYFKSITVPYDLRSWSECEG